MAVALPNTHTRIALEHFYFYIRITYVHELYMYILLMQKIFTNP